MAQASPPPVHPSMRPPANNPLSGTAQNTAITSAAAAQTAISNDVSDLRKEILDLRGALLKVTSDVQEFHDQHLSKHKAKTEERSRWFP